MSWCIGLADGGCCIYAHSNMPAAQLLRNARERAELSVRALAARADLAASTVSRIEARLVSPTVETLERLLAACGQDLKVSSTPSRIPSLAALADAWESDGPDWTRLRAFLDQLARNPERSAPATLKAPPSRSAVMDNLLAAIAETIADEAEVPPPKWTRDIPPLESEWAVPGTPRMQEAWRRATPSRFAKRGLVVDRASLWRQPLKVHA